MKLSLLLLVFSPSLSAASRLLHPNSLEDKILKLLVKPFSTDRNTQRYSHSYIEKRRGRREIEVTRRRKEGVERGNLASNLISKCSPHPSIQRDSQSCVEERKGGRR